MDKGEIIQKILSSLKNHAIRYGKQFNTEEKFLSLDFREEEELCDIAELMGITV